MVLNSPLNYSMHRRRRHFVPRYTCYDVHIIHNVLYVYTVSFISVDSLTAYRHSMRRRRRCFAEGTLYIYTGYITCFVYYMYMYAYIYTYMYIHLSISICIHINIIHNTCIYIYIYIYMCVHTHVYLSLSTYIYIYTCI